MTNSFFNNHCSKIIEAVKNHQGLCVMEGSNDPFSAIATSFWIIKGNNDTGCCKGYNMVYRDKTYMDPYQSELHRIHCIMLFLKYLCLLFDITEGSTKIVCNCKGTLQRIFKWTERLNTGAKHFDVLWFIYEIWESLMIAKILEHVYGHQDEVRRPLTWMETLNCKADHGEKSYLNNAQIKN